MSIEVAVSVGEFLDKLSILKIKLERIEDESKRLNVRREKEALEAVWADSPFRSLDLEQEIGRLRTINQTLWDVEDRIRVKEAREEFDAEFIELARSVYVTNDERAATIKDINLKSGSNLVGEKSYRDY